MNQHLHLLPLAAVAAMLVAGCDDPTASLGRHNSGNGDPNDPANVAAALQCTDAPQGRSYALFDGTKLEASRANENVGVNRARVKPFSVLEGEYKRVLGTVAPSIKDSAASFPSPPARWYSENTYAATSLNAVAELSFKSCVEYTKTAAEFAEAPTAETARTECESLMRKAWSRSASPEEIAGCTDLALTGVADETDVRRRWAYTCASVLSASQFLTF